MINPQLLTLNRFEIRLAGKGGQGLVKSGLILAQAIAKEGNNVLQLQSYGPEARGGASRSDVIVGDTSYPGVLSLDVLVALSQEAYDKYLHLVKSNGIVIFDPDLVRPILVEGINQHAVPFTKIAESLGNKMYANSVVMGYLIALTNLVSKNVVKDVMAKVLPKKTVEDNLKAFEIGYEKCQR